MAVRLQKFMANSGVCSRRAAEKLIANGEVKVNGLVVTEMGIKIDPMVDEVEYKNEVLSKVEEMAYYLLHKPTRVVSTAADENGRTTVVEMVASSQRLYPVGRLDYMSSGLIILTNDGDLTYRLTHPKHEIEKEYKVTVTPAVSLGDIKMLRAGVNLDGQMTQPCKIEFIEEKYPVADLQAYTFVLREGKNRQIRRMIELVGSEVKTLERVAIGDIKISGLKYGASRALTKEEVAYLKSL